MSRMQVLLVCALFACGGKARPSPVPTPEPAEPRVDPARLEIVALEARRTAAIDRLRELAEGGEDDVRLWAVRGLGRVGGTEAGRALIELADDPDPAVREAALWWLGPAGASGALPLLRERALGGDRPERLAAIASLGRLGTAEDAARLAGALADREPVAVREAAAYALGRLGRREVPLSDEAGRALASAATGHGSRAVSWALWREHEPGSAPEVTRVLRDLIRRTEGTARAYAVAALGRRAATPADSELFLEQLRADDWRIRVEAVRALGEADLTDEQVALWAVAMAREWALSSPDVGPSAHVLTEGLRALRDHAEVDAVAQVAAELQRLASGALGSDAPGRTLLASTVHCLASDLRVRAGEPIAVLRGCGGPASSGMPVHERRALLVDLLTERDPGDVAVDVAGALAAADDPRVRARAMELAGAMLDDRSPDDDAAAERYSTLVAILAAGLEADAAVVVDAAAEAVVAMAEGGDPAADELAGAVVERARTAGDAELRASLALRAAALDPDAALPICRRLLVHPNRTSRARGRDCVETVTGEDPGPGAPSAEPDRPPVEPRSVLGARIRWTLRTTRGAVAIDLDPDLAPWHVAALVKLTEGGLYDDTLWHRVVPSFVVQGGDPSGTGWGGPGFTLPGEPSRRPYRRGTVGIADAGLDTGGSQFFVMHTRHPHLDGRYTVVGEVVRGMEVVDALMVGDRIVEASVAVGTDPRSQ